jgi:hypothetical protein
MGYGIWDGNRKGRGSNTKTHCSQLSRAGPEGQGEATRDARPRAPPPPSICLCARGTHGGEGQLSPQYQIHSPLPLSPQSAACVQPLFMALQLQHSSALHSPACTPSPISHPPRPACIWPVQRGARPTLSLCKLCPLRKSPRSQSNPTHPSRCALPAALAVSISRGRCAAVARATGRARASRGSNPLKNYQEPKRKRWQMVDHRSAPTLH